MAGHEREEYGEDPTTKLQWRISLRQLNKLVEHLLEYDHLFRIRRSAEGALPPDCVVWYIEPLEEYSLTILVEQTPRRGKFDLTVSRGLLPVIRDILGTKLPPGEEVF